jgi:hypothetical protein
MPPARTDMLGRRFGRLTVTRRDGTNHHNFAMWACLCDCGETTRVSTGALIKGNTKSCGCLARDTTGNRARTHGMSKTPEYRVWSLMRDRCSNPNNKKFADYGGRGIAVHATWQTSFEAFFADMGKRPFPRAEIERINNNGNYEPGNCRWATRQEQTRNKRNNHLLTFNGRTQTIAAWAGETGIPARTIRKRVVEFGWDVAKALDPTKYGSRGRFVTGTY